MNIHFKKVLEGAIKRTVWLSRIPELTSLEAETIDEEFKSDLISYIRNPEGDQKVLTVRRLPELGEKIQEMVAAYLVAGQT